MLLCDHDQTVDVIYGVETASFYCIMLRENIVKYIKGTQFHVCLDIESNLRSAVSDIYCQKPKVSFLQRPN